ncbi:uncharacterized protein uno [Calliphora vicina]|uniref:uncharacterized protein uno n=1 Tax=Calliphora vicina TaxID=7373 RepID=UPI00325B5BC0
MAMKKEKIPKQNYRIKLLAGNSVILLEADNYESEIFMPQIVNGRITLLNIIPNRRCCQVSKTNVMNFAKKESNEQKTYLKEQNVMKSRKLGRMSSDGQYSVMCAPLANSTPASVKQRNSCGSMPAQRFVSPSPYGKSTDSYLPTPEPVRRAVAASPTLLDKSQHNLPPGIKVARIYHNSMEGTPKKVGRLVTSDRNISGRHSSANVSFLSGSFRLPCSPAISTNSNNRRSAISTPADSIARWQKVLTPVRTYTRNSKKPIMVRRPVSVGSAKKALKSSKVIPTYLVNPTQGPNVTQQIEMRKRKLIIDKKVGISPKSFKRQQREPVESYKSPANLLHPHSLSLQMPCRFVKSMAMSAFDLLTNSNRHCRMTAKLNQQFRKGCVNKASSTYSKYKLLCSVPQLQQDEQILELSRISLQSSDSPPDTCQIKRTSNNI